MPAEPPAANLPAGAPSRPTRAHHERPEEHDPRRRAVGGGAAGLAILHRHSADGETEADRPAATDPAAAGTAARRAWGRGAPAGAGRHARRNAGPWRAGTRRRAGPATDPRGCA